MILDIDAVKKDKDKKLQTLNKRKENLESKLNNQNFITKAPEAVVVCSKKRIKKSSKRDS